jgi:SHS2 domain-containing protein
MEHCRVVDHEADIGFEVYAGTEEELFQRAAGALFSLITDCDKVGPVKKKEIKLSGNGELLVVFLNELLYLWDVEKFIPKTVVLNRQEEQTAITVEGEYFDEGRHTVKTEVKAVTYHMFSLTNEKGRLKATFVVDL